MKESRKRWSVHGLFFLALGVGAALHAGGCIGPQTCENLRTELRVQRQSWDGCDPNKGDEQCAIVGGDSSDCTGVFQCSFAVNKNNLTAAQNAVVDNSIRQGACADFCPSPICPGGTVAICDHSINRCVIPFADPDGGAAQASPGGPDAQAE
jgi:hypothetical protein